MLTSVFESQSIPVLNHNMQFSEILEKIVIEDDVHDVSGICDKVKDYGIPCSRYVVLSRLQKDSNYIEIQSNFWESKRKLLKEVEEFLLANIEEFQIRTTRSMPEMETIVKPSLMGKRIPRYAKFNLSEIAFGEAVVISALSIVDSPLIATNGVLVNFREAFVKDLYNVLLRERAPLCSLDVALRLFDSKVGIYKRSLKDFISGKRNKDQVKVMHHPLNPNEVYRFSRLIEKVFDIEIKNRPNVFIRLPDGRMNAYRNHIGIIRVKLTEDNYLTINMNNEMDVTRHVQTVIDANKPFLSKLIKQFRSQIDEEEIHSRFYEKIWQAIIQYDEIWGHKFHTFLHRALKNILLDERTKRDKIPPSISLNTTINEKNSEELGNIFQDRLSDPKIDPVNRVHSIRFVEMLKDGFSNEEQQVMFLLMDGYKDREIAANMKKSIADVVLIKKNLSHSSKLISWFGDRRSY